nr:MAG TPA: hypothetical protein [Bacteriophage sp.]
MNCRFNNDIFRANCSISILFQREYCSTSYLTYTIHRMKIPTIAVLPP